MLETKGLYAFCNTVNIKIRYLRKLVYKTRYSRMDQVKFVEDSLQKILKRYGLLKPVIIENSHVNKYSIGNCRFKCM